MRTNEAVKKAIDAAGSIAKLAEKCEVSRTAVYQWLEKGVSPERAVHIERVLHGAVSRREFCPDLFNE